MAENNNRVELIKEQLLSVADKPPRTEVILSQEDITFLCQSALEIFKKENSNLFHNGSLIIRIMILSDLTKYFETNS